MSENEIRCSTSLSTLRSSSADNRSSVIVLRNLFFINAIRLNERSPEQLETIKHMNMRSTMETFGNVSCSSSVCINMARSDGDENPLHLAKVTQSVSSHRENSRLQICTVAYVSVARCAKFRGKSGAPFSGGPRAMAQLAQWLIRHRTQTG